MAAAACATYRVSGSISAAAPSVSINGERGVIGEPQGFGTSKMRP
jgi:hypothetical protein